MDLGLKGKSVLVTAASKGLGKASALAFANEGAMVTIASRHLEELKRAAADIEASSGQKVTTVQMDVTREEDIAHAVRTAVEAGGGLDVLVTNAGGPPAGSFDQFDDQAWTKAFELNLLSAIRLIRASQPHMRSQGAGRIVTITSSTVKQPLPNMILSNTIRAGVQALAKSLAMELAKDGILVNTVAPGRIMTDRVAELDSAKAEKLGVSLETVQAELMTQIPLGRYGQPEEFGKAVAFLGSFANTYISGQALLVDGGMIKSL